MKDHGGGGFTPLGGGVVELQSLVPRRRGAVPPPAAAGAAPVPAAGAWRWRAMLLLLAALGAALLVEWQARSAVVVAEGDVAAGDQAAASRADAAGGVPAVPVRAVPVPAAPGVPAVAAEGYGLSALVNATDFVLPGTEGAPALSAAKGRPYRPVSNHFQRRDPASPFAEKWGAFAFRDPDPAWDGTPRPQPDFAAAPHRDVANAAFPAGAWQRDAAYMTAFLAEARRLVNRTMEAVYAEYGVGLPADGGGAMTAEQRAQRDAFAPFLVKDTVDQPHAKTASWTTFQSLEDCARRFIHHITTGDTFNLVLGGHSAAAGHGAGFNQSYIIEAGHVLEPVFAHLGVEMRAYNFAQGGMGTLQQALAGMDLRGKETDWIVWDSSMTERPSELHNFFFRQALISGHRAPALMGNGVKLNDFHTTADAAVFAEGDVGWSPATMSEEQVKEVPWAARYLNCGKGATTTCKGNGKEYTAGCWVEREDFSPKTKQDDHVGGQASWHPGNRVHKRRGRAIALVILRTLEYALEKWESFAQLEGYPIPERLWHVTGYYDSVREKAKDVPGCWKEDAWKIGQKRRLSETAAAGARGDGTGRRGRALEGALEGDFWPARLCNLPLQGRTLWGPRHNPMETSLLAIMRPNPMGDRDPNIRTPAATYMEGPCYQPPDRPAPWNVPPAGEPFAPSIGAARRLALAAPDRRRLGSRVDGNPSPGEATEGASFVDVEWHNASVSRSSYSDAQRALAEEVPPVDEHAIVPGYGINVKWGVPGVCDGTSHNWCQKNCGNKCLMNAGQDNRGMVCFNGYSGWLVFDLKNVKHGFIGARMEPWHDAQDVPITAGWTSVNNGGKGNYEKRGRERRLHEEYQQRRERENAEKMREDIEADIRDAEGDGDPGRRRLGGGQSCGKGGDYTFEWAIDGEIVSWTKAEFCAHFTRLAYNLDVMKFMDDATRTGDFEVAMRMTNVGNAPVMCLTHLYWA